MSNDKLNRIIKDGETMNKSTLADLKLPNRFEAKLKRDIDYLLAYEGLALEKIILFGSCARGDYKVTSDIDLLVVTSLSTLRYIRGDIASELDEAIDGVRTDVIFYGREVFETSDSLLMRQIRKEGVMLYDALQ